jgi:hypothetical protein
LRWVKGTLPVAPARAEIKAKRRKLSRKKSGKGLPPPAKPRDHIWVNANGPALRLRHLAQNVAVFCELFRAAAIHRNLTVLSEPAARIEEAESIRRRDRWQSHPYLPGQRH